MLKRAVEAPGEMVAVPGGALHLQRCGSEGPTVILESGLAATSLSWVLVQPKIGRFASAISYDRRGLGFSPAGKAEHSLEHLLEDLHELIVGAQLPGPYFLVGHSFGGLLVRAYAHAHPEQIAGLVLLDPVSLAAWADPRPEDVRRLAMGAKLCRRGAVLARLGVVGAALWMLAAGGRRLPSLIGRVAAGKGSSVIARLTGEVAKLPKEMHPMIRAHWSRPGSFEKLAEYLEGLPAAAKQARGMPPPLHIPMTILSAATATADELREREAWIVGRYNSRHEVIPNTTHWLQLDAPEVVIDWMREMVERRYNDARGIIHAAPEPS